MFGNYSKLAGSIAGGIVGNLVALAFVYAGFKGWATCTDVNSVESCTLFGFTAAQVTGAIVALINPIFVYIAAANVPSTGETA